jgi:mono/diheme cytochrome c family protein
VAGAPSKFKKAWEPTPELVAHGKGLFEAQCTACHGANGGGDGPAASALNPKPRNFHLADGWKNGRKPSQIFKTLKEGIAGGAMASFAGVPEADRWAMSHYVATLGPDLLKDSETDLAAVGVDPNKAEVVAEEKPTLPVEMALEIMAEPDKGRGHLVEGTVSDVETNAMENYSRRLDQSLQKRRY